MIVILFFYIMSIKNVSKNGIINKKYRLNRYYILMAEQERFELSHR